jgi:Radical SAM superfamily
MPFSVGLLEIHAAHACNLTCESCSHFSNSGHKGFPEVDEADAWMKSWNRRVVPHLFRILGGEPTLNPQLPEFIEVAARNWPHSRIGLTTNGFFLHRHPRLPEVLSRHNVVLRLTIHHQSEEYLARARVILSLVDAWRRDHPFEFVVEEAYERWTRRHLGFGSGVLPFTNRNPARSWETCPCKNCMQLFLGRLWKCSPITYLRLQKGSYPDLSPQWDDYLAYQGLGPGCSDEELRTFLERKEESICGMCSASPVRFDKPSPLIPLGVLRQAAMKQAG